MKMTFVHPDEDEGAPPADHCMSAVFEMSQSLFGMGDANITIRFFGFDMAVKIAEANNFKKPPTAHISWEGGPEGDAYLFPQFDTDEPYVIDSLNNLEEIIVQDNRPKLTNAQQDWLDNLTEGDEDRILDAILTLTGGLSPTRRTMLNDVLILNLTRHTEEA